MLSHFVWIVLGVVKKDVVVDAVVVDAVVVDAVVVSVDVDVVDVEVVVSKGQRSLFRKKLSLYL